MSSDTIFLQSTASSPNPNPNFANAQGFALFFNYSQASSGSLTDVQTDTLVKGGVAVAIADAQATFFNSEPTFSTLFTDDTGIGSEGAFVGSANSQTKVIANFAVGANQTFSFDFSADLSLSAKEIENRNIEYNQVQSKTTFLVLDTTNPDKPKILDYFGIRGNLISSKGIGDLRLGGSRNVSIINREQTSDINGNKGQDSLTANVIGRYQKKFKQNTNITIVEVNTSSLTFLGDTLINNLGSDVNYGTIRNDSLTGNNCANKIYGSLGNDLLKGRRGDDILEGGQGNDRLYGDEGNDKLHGGLGNDLLIGGTGNDVLVGGDGNDKFVFERCDSLLKGEFDIIQDFQVGIDKILFDGWGNLNSEQWLSQMFSQGQITDTIDGVLFNFNTGITQGQLLLSGVTSDLITSDSIGFI
ncbi:M10 family metallopeptidase C-terminal domain-containing protein [Nostoc punctiforme UO1]|uniref:calcium-binding protein n=1 Tax=Nostoc punctiforme TaxID=272131 RepID=UPI0030B60F05